MNKDTFIITFHCAFKPALHATLCFTGVDNYKV